MSAADDPRRGSWDPPTPLGYPASIQSLGGFAAPLLAAAAFTMTALVLSASASVIRWSDATLTLFVLSGLAQIGAVQAAVWARRYDATPAELVDWFPEDVHGGRPNDGLRSEQVGHMAKSRRWADRTRAFYHVGILALLTGLTAAVIPPEPLAPSRWFLVGVAICGVVGELGWIVLALVLAPAHRDRAFVHAGIALAAMGSGLLAATGGGRWSLVATAALVLAFLAASVVARSTGGRWSRALALSGAQRRIDAVVMAVLAVGIAMAAADADGAAALVLFAVGMATAAVTHGARFVAVRNDDRAG